MYSCTHRIETNRRTELVSAGVSMFLRPYKYYLLSSLTVEIIIPYLRARGVPLNLGDGHVPSSEGEVSNPIV